MSITSPVPDEQGLAFTAVGQRCFYCDAPLADPAIHWMGSGGHHLYLHSQCALQLFVRLARDVHELEKPDYYRRRGGR